MLKKLQIAISILLINTSYSFAENNTKNQANQSLEKYFNVEQIKNIISYKSDFEKINSVKNLSDVYKKSYRLKSSLNNSLEKTEDPKIENFMWIKKYLPGLDLVYGVEGMNIYLTPNYKQYLKKAEITSGMSDDRFLNLMISIYGEAGEAYPNWFVMTWDLGGYTLLGKGTHFKTLEKINYVLQKSPEFKTEINSVRERLIKDILYSSSFSVSKEDVIKEINQIINSKYLSIAEKNLLVKRINQLNKTPKEFLFNCEKEECAFD